MMDVKVPAGKYVVAVSGGVDSMALLDILSHQRGVQLIVAHFDHGIREDSNKDARLVERVAKAYGLRFESERAELGSDTSENEARNARYDFLKRVKNSHDADKIITAHHQDDLIETAFLNILRGTGPRGLIAIVSNPDVIRPLIGFPKAKIIEYAQRRNLSWREDPTNTNSEYLRNYIRQTLMPRLSSDERRKILENIDKVAKYKENQRKIIEKISQNLLNGNKIDRKKLTMLPVEVGKEVVSGWLASVGVEIDRKLVERLVIMVKTARPGSVHDVKGKTKLLVEKDFAVLTEG